MAMSAEHTGRSKFAALRWQWWPLDMSEKFSSGTKKTQTNEYTIYFYASWLIKFLSKTIVYGPTKVCNNKFIISISKLRWWPTFKCCSIQLIYTIFELIYSIFESIDTIFKFIYTIFELMYRDTIWECCWEIPNAICKFRY